MFRQTNDALSLRISNYRTFNSCGYKTTSNKAQIDHSGCLDTRAYFSTDIIQQTFSALSPSRHHHVPPQYVNVGILVASLALNPTMADGGSLFFQLLHKQPVKQTIKPSRDTTLSGLINHKVMSPYTLPTRSYLLHSDTMQQKP